MFHLREALNQEQSKICRKKKQKPKTDSQFEQGKEGGSTQKKRVSCFVITYVWSLRSTNAASVSHTPCMSICLQLPIDIIDTLILLANLHQSKASLGEHFKFGNIEPFCRQFLSLNEVVFKTLLDLEASSKSKIPCLFFSFMFQGNITDYNYGVDGAFSRLVAGTYLDKTSLQPSDLVLKK